MFHNYTEPGTCQKEYCGVSMMCDLTDVERMLINIRSDVSEVRTDIVWMKRIVFTLVAVIGGVFGLDTSGMI